MIGLFLPDRIGNYYLFAKRVVGIQITQKAIYATVMLLKGTSRTVESIVEEPFEQNIVEALKALKIKLGKVDEVSYALSSAQVIFKELTMPFVGPKKVKLVVPFEVESLLPFNLEEGLISTIITKEDAHETDILVAAIKKEVRDTYVGYFMDADLPLDKLTVDMFELYGLYTEQGKEKVTSILIDIGHSSSHLALLVDGNLQYIRSFSQGTDNLEGLLDKIKITAETTLQRYRPGGTLQKVIISGAVTDKEALKEHFNLPIELFTPDSTDIKQNVTVPGTYMIALATAYCPLLTDGFTLLQEKAFAEEHQRITRQLLTAGILILTIFISFSLYSFLRVRTLKNSYKSGEKEAIAELQRNFKLKGNQANNLLIANKTALAELRKQETAWRRISPDNRYAYLKYLAELTKCINKKESGLVLESIILKDDTIKLYGSVPEYHNLPKLQKQLDCRPFLKVAKLQDPNFKTEPITLTVNPEEL